MCSIFLACGEEKELAQLLMLVCVYNNPVSITHFSLRYMLNPVGAISSLLLM